MSVLRSSLVLRTGWRGYRSQVSLDKLYPGRETIKVTPPDLSSAKFTFLFPVSLSSLSSLPQFL